MSIRRNREKIAALKSEMSQLERNALAALLRQLRQMSPAARQDFLMYEQARASQDVARERRSAFILHTVDSKEH